MGHMAHAPPPVDQYPLIHARALRRREKGNPLARRGAKPCGLSRRREVAGQPNGGGVATSPEKGPSFSSERSRAYGKGYLLQGLVGREDEDKCCTAIHCGSGYLFG